jgi:hypothetical protein
MCFGGKSKAAPATPAPSPPTTFGYVAPDTSNDRTNQARASMISDTSKGAFGSELSAGSSAAQTPATNTNTMLGG